MEVSPFFRCLQLPEEEKKRGYEKGLADGKLEIATQKLELVDSSVAFMESVEQKMADVVIRVKNGKIRSCEEQDAPLSVEEIDW